MANGQTQGEAVVASPGLPPAGVGPDALTASAIVLVCVGALLRAWNFWGPELWIDEYATRWVVADVTWSEAARRAIHSQGQSPFFYWLLGLSGAPFGFNPFSLRLPSVLFGIGSVALAWPLALKIFRQRGAALCAVAVFALNPRLIGHAQQARPYALALLLVMLSFLAYLALLERDTPGWRIAWVLCTAGVFYAHYVLSFVAVVQLIHLCLVRGTAWLRSKAWPLSWLALIAACAPGLPQLRSLFERRAALNWLAPADWQDRVQLVATLLDLPTLAVVGLAMVLAGFSAEQFRALLDRSRAALLAVWLVVPLAVFGAVLPLFGVSVFSVRYLVFTLPAALLLMAWVMSLVRPQAWRRWIPLAAFLLVSVVFRVAPSLLGGTSESHGFDGWAQAVPALEREVGSDDVVLYSSGFVEADGLRSPNPDPLTVSFIESPVTANLSPGRTLAMLDLPFRVSAETGPYVSSVFARAFGAKRVWVVGTGEPAAAAVAVLEHEASFRAVRQQVFGSVRLTLLERSAP